MSYWGDFPLEETLNFLFTTRAFATGVPTVLAGTPVLSVYEDTNLVQITTGVTVTVDHDGVVGLNRANVVATAANGYEAGKTYTVVITTGTVGGVSVVGEVVGNFTIDRGAALRPTTAGNTLDVAATGEAGVDFGNILGTLDAAEIGANAITAAKINAGALDGKGDWNIGKTGYSLTQAFPTNFAAFSITAGGLVDITQAAADKAWSTTTRTLTAFSTALALSIWDVLESAILTASSIGLKVKNNLDAVLTARTLASASYATSAVATEARLAELDGANIPTDLAAIQADTDDIQTRLPAALVAGRIDASVGAMAANVLTAAAINAAALTAAKFAAGAIDANALATDAVDEIRDAILPTQNAAFDNIMFLFVAASDHVTPVTGATGTAVTRSIDGAAFGAGTGTLAEVSNGIYQYDASAADMNGGIITFRFTGTGGTPGAPDDRFVTIVTGGGV